MLRKIIWDLLTIILILLTALNLLLVAGTFFQALPLVGTLSNVFTVGFAHYWLLYVLIVCALCMLLAHIHSSRLLRAAWIVSAVTLLCGVFIIASAIHSVNSSGGDAGFFQSYTQASYDEVDRDTVCYEDVISDTSYLDVYYTDDGKTDKPVVLYIHGGGWTGGTRDENSSYMEQFAENGYVAISVDYNLSSADSHGISTVEQQLTYAVVWVQNDISAYGGNTNRFYIVGDSAGGNLALELAYKINDGTYEIVDDTTLPEVTATSVLYPVTDMASCYYNDHPLFTAAAKEMVCAYMGTIPEEDPGLYASASPINRVSENSPATCILVGAHDTVVSPSQSYRLQEELEAAGIDNKLVKVAYANHLFDAGGTNFGAQAYMNITLDWFAHHG